MTVFLDTPVDKSPTTIDVWIDVDLSSEIPEGATGAIFQIENTSIDYYRFGIRKKGSTYNRWPAISPYALKFAIAGVDSNRKCQVKTAGLVIDLFLVGYTLNDAVFFTNGYNKSQTTTGVWADLDLSTELSEGAVAAIFEIENASTSAKSFGMRKKGSSDNRYGDLGASYPNMFFIVGVDADRKCQYKIETSAIKFSLLGYLKAGEAETNGIDRSLGSTDSYIDITESSAPANATGVFVEFDTLSINADFAARKNGSSWNKYCYPQTHKNMIFVGLDGSKKWEGKIATTAHDFYTLGYFYLGGVDKFSSDVGIGIEGISSRGFTSAETGAGLDEIVEQLVAVLKSDQGSGLEAEILKRIDKMVDDSDIGNGVDVISKLEAAVNSGEEGVGQEGLGSRDFGAAEEGIGVDEIANQLVTIMGADQGLGLDAIKSVCGLILNNDSGSGIESKSIDIYMCILLKLLQKRGLKLKRTQEKVKCEE